MYVPCTLKKYNGLITSPQVVSACTFQKSCECPCAHVIRCVLASTGMSDAAIMELNLPTGIPIVYELDKDLKPIKPMQFLGDEETVSKAMEAVAAQGKVKKWRGNRPKDYKRIHTAPKSLYLSLKLNRVIYVSLTNRIAFYNFLINPLVCHGQINFNRPMCLCILGAMLWSVNVYVNVYFYFYFKTIPYPKHYESGVHLWMQAITSSHLTTAVRIKSTWHGHDCSPNLLQTPSHNTTKPSPLLIFKSLVLDYPTLTQQIKLTTILSTSFFAWLIPPPSFFALTQGFQQNGALLCKLTQRAHQRGCWVRFGSRPTLWCSGISSSSSSQYKSLLQTAHCGNGKLPALQLESSSGFLVTKGRAVLVCDGLWLEKDKVGTRQS